MKDDNNFYNGNPLLPKAGVKRALSDWEVEEFKRCAADPVYFADNYFYAVHQEHGLQQIKLYYYQKEAIEKYNDSGRLIMLTARQVGKLEHYKNPIPLFSGGFKTMEDITVGDIIIGSDGKPTKITYKTPAQYQKMYRVIFDDKTYLDVGAEHNWTVHNRFKGHKKSTLTTKQILDSRWKFVNSRGYNEYAYYIPNIKPVEYQKNQLPIDPYMLGVWLGDGMSDSPYLTCHKDDFDHYVSQGLRLDWNKSRNRNNKRRVHIFEGKIDNLSRQQLRDLDLLKNKHIPDCYLYSSKQDRIALLQGIVDTDGYVGKSNGLIEIQLSKKNIRLLDNVEQLLCSLGLKVTKKHFENNNFKNPAPSLRLSFTADRDEFDVCRMQRKLQYQKSNLKCRRYVYSRTIQDIVEIPTEKAYCISVDATDHLYASGKQYQITHNTTVATAIILHAALFNKNKNIALLANLQSTAIEIMDRIKEAYENLPLFLKQGVRTWNKKTVKFENGCTIFANASKGSSIRGKSIYLLYVDECAFVDNWQDFAASTLPTITSNKNAKIIYTSTPNGLNHFFEYCTLAKAGKNGFEYVEVPWYKVDGRDDEWKQKTLADMNYDEERFKVEQECEFMGSSGTLISGATLKILQHVEPFFNHDNLKIYKDKKDNGIYAIVVDTSRGKGLDYCAFSVIDIAGAPYEQVATYRSNTTTPQDYAQIINRVAKHYNNAFVLIELNDGVGLVVSESLFWDYEYENILMTESAGRAGKKISSGFGGANVDRGLYMSKTTKAIGCSMLKLLVEQKQLIINDKDTIDELRTFSKKGQSYEAEEGKHDDMVMGLVLFSWLSTQEYFKSVTDLDINQHLKELTNQDVEDYVAGMGIMAFSDGMSDFDPEYALM